MVTLKLIFSLFSRAWWLRFESSESHIIERSDLQSHKRYRSAGIGNVLSTRAKRALLEQIPIKSLVCSLARRFCESLQKSAKTLMFLRRAFLCSHRLELFWTKNHFIRMPWVSQRGVRQKLWSHWLLATLRLAVYEQPKQSSCLRWSFTRIHNEKWRFLISLRLINTTTEMITGMAPSSCDNCGIDIQLI